MTDNKLSVLICTIPLLASFFPPTSGVKTTLASWLASAYCFGNLTFLGIAQRNVGIVGVVKPSVCT